MPQNSGDQTSTTANKTSEPKRPYSPPAIIYATKITTRAGSPLSADDAGGSGVDPMDLFGE